MSRSSASARLRSWVRWFCAISTSSPSLVMRRPARRISRSATSLGNDGERRTSKRNCTAVESLLTFCPPGPEARTKLSWISLSSMLMLSVIRIMAKAADRESRLLRRLCHGWLAEAPLLVMPGLVPGIHVFATKQDVDGRDKPGHDDH